MLVLFWVNRSSAGGNEGTFVCAVAEKMVEHHTAQLAVAGKLRFSSCGGSAVKENFPIQVGIFPGNILWDVLVKDPLCRSIQRSAVGGDS